MIKFTALAFLAAGMFAASAAFAGEGKACCAHGAKQGKKEACAATFAQLDLSAEQTSKMETLAAECDKAGCTKESMAKMERAAKGILSKEQFASWQAACRGGKA